MIISLRIETFLGKHGVSLQIIRRMQRGYIQDLQQGEVNFKEQEKIDITTRNLKNILGRKPNWKSPGLDLVQGFWLKNFSSLYERLKLQLKECLDSGFVPSSLTREGLWCYRNNSKDNLVVIIDL